MVNAISTLIGEELEGREKYRGTLAASNGSIYGIPCCARRVVKFDQVSKSITHIGPDLGDDGWKWYIGAITDNGVIYCVSYHPRRRGILKIDTKTDGVTELDRNFLPQRGITNLWRSCAFALDGCIYCMPSKSYRIMKIDPNNNDAISSVGDDLGFGSCKYGGTVAGIDGCVYGIPYSSKRILKYNPINDTTSYVGEEAYEGFYCGGGALGRDGCIYAITRDGMILKIDTTNNSHCFVGNSVESDHHGEGWGDAILGIDGCIYGAPFSARRILKYDPHSDQTSLLGDDFGISVDCKWHAGCLTSDGVIYCLPRAARRIISIDPWKDYSLSLEHKMVQHPEQLGCIFHPSDDIPKKTNFDRAVTKFGYKKVLKALEACMPSADQVCAACNLYPFMIAASFNNSDISVIYHLLRQVPACTNYNNRAHNR